MPNLTFYQILVLLLVAIIGTIAVKITFSFDLNKYLEDRRSRFSQKLKNACTHTNFIETSEGNYGLQSLFISPPGTLQWQCQRCGLTKFLNEGEIDRQMQYYLKNPKEFSKQQKRFTRLLKKSGQI